MKTITEFICSGNYTNINNYDSSKMNLGSLIFSKGNYVGPMPVAVTRPMEASITTTAFCPAAIPWSTGLHWLFLTDNSSATATRRVVMYEYNIANSEFTWKGIINISGVTAGNKTIRGFRPLYYTHTTGTVAASTTGVVGSGTLFVTERIAAGARIGFGTTNPNDVTGWYDISSITSDTALAISNFTGTVPSGSQYVIEELRMAFAITNATATNGGLFLVKGLNPSVFSPVGTNIADATTIDNQRACYWLANAATVTNTVSAGMGIDDVKTPTQHNCWILNGTTTAQIFKYNLRADLTGLSAGKSTAAFEFSTGISSTLTGTASQVNNGRVITTQHGPGSGIKSFYFTTTTRVYRCAENTLASGVTNFLSDAMAEIPPGGSNTYALTSALQSVDYSDSIDRLILLTTGSAGARSYITRYNTNSDPFDHIFLIDTKQTDQSTADQDGVVHPTINATAMSVWSEAGIFYLCRNGATSALNQVYAVPIGAHWTYAETTKQRFITPSLATTDAIKLYKVYVNSARQLGGGTLGSPPEPFRVYARTSGIDDNSGSWILIGDDGDLSGLTPGVSIQFMIEFKTMGTFCVPNRIYNVSVSYENNTTDSHYTPSVTKSNASSRIFAWRQAFAWGSNIPNMRIRIYNVNTDGSVLDDTVNSSSAGTWEYSTDGTNWSAWSAAADAVGNYIRYTATSLPDGIPVRAVLTQ